MNLIIVTPYIPYPLTHGGSVAQYGIIDYIRNHVKLTLVLVINNVIDKDNIEKLKRIWDNVDFEIIDEQPTINFSQKFFNGIRKLKNYSKDDDNFKMQIRDSTTLYWAKSDSLIERFVEILNRRKPDLVQIDFLDYVDLALLIPKNIKSVFVHHELRFAKMESIMAIESVVSPNDTYLYNETKVRELAFLKLYDGIIVFSEVDKDKLGKFIDGVNILISPFSIPFSHFEKQIKKQTEIKKIIFIGGEGHPPNVDAIQWYIDEIASELAKYNDLSLHIIGKWENKTIEKYNNPFIHFAGYVDDISAYGADSIMIVPIRIGSGIRTKILDAMAFGIPLVTTSIGCEGIKGLVNKDFLIADDAKEFAMMIDQLYRDDELRNNMLLVARETAYNTYSPKNAGDLRIMSYDKVLNSEFSLAVN